MDLGLERAGMQCAWQVEIDEFCRKVLAKHWPNVPKFYDVRECGKHNLEPVDVIAGGFPCQDVSEAGPRVGIDGDRSGLWAEYQRIIRELRPCFVLVENAAGLLHRGLERVLSDLASCGYDAEWQMLSACAFGAPHPRERLFIVAYPCTEQRGIQPFSGQERENQTVFNTDGPKIFMARPRRRSEWETEPAVCRVVNGISRRLYADEYEPRRAALGNAVVPQVAEWIGTRIRASFDQQPTDSRAGVLN